MHNSENGGDMVHDEIGGSSYGGDCQGCHNVPREELLVYTCIGCHAKGTAPIDSPGTLDIPQVLYPEGGQELAAGNFSYVASDYTKGHNVHGFGATINPDLKLFAGPPGYSAAMNPSTWDYITDYPGAIGGGVARPVLCAGAFGCHGNRDIKSQSQATHGTHHADDSALKFGTAYDADEQGATPGASYRYLNGVEGYEDADWEYSVGPNDHNEYSGIDVTDRSAQTEVTTMSQFCASCHGNFHMAGQSDGSGITPSAGLNSPWIRHPTDVMIPDKVPYNNYTDYMTTGAAGADELSVRVARIHLDQVQDGAEGTTQISSGNAVVFCLSCHKAHASQYSDILRFSYDDMIAGNSSTNSTGCFACHRDK